MPKLNIRQGSKIFNAGKTTLHALQDINLSIHENEFVALVGASGCGKSTLLRIIGGPENFTAGDVSVDALPIVGTGHAGLQFISMAYGGRKHSLLP